MKLTFRTINGKNFNVEAEGTTLVSKLKADVEESQGAAFPKDAMKLVYKGKILDDEAKPISDYGVDESGFLVVFIQKKPAAAPAAVAAAPTDAGTSAAAAPTSTPAAATATDAAAASAPAAAAPPAAPAAAAAAAAAPEPAPVVAAGSGLLSGDALTTAVNSICEMGFEREEVVRAMRAAFNNPERAVEYLMNGLPASAAPPPAPPAPGAVAAGGVAGPAPGQGGAGAAGPPAPEAFDMFGGGGGGGGGGAGRGAARAGARAGGGAGGGGGSLDFLRENAQFQMLRRAVQANPGILVPMLQELGKQNPQLLQTINANQQEFLQMVMEPPGEGEEGGLPEGLGELLGGMGAGGPGGGMVIELSAEDDAAITRLEGLGFDRDACVEAYLACDKNEEIAANYLMDSANMAD